jgi:hypothetical protein
MHYRSEFKDGFVWERLWTFVIEVDEKFKDVRLLLNHVEFFA